MNPIFLKFFFLFAWTVYSQQPPIEQINAAVSESLNEKSYDSIYSALRLKEGDRIKVFVQFTIDEEGKVTDIVTRGPYLFFEQEAKRIMERLPTFPPIVVDGVAKRMNFSLPITFVVEREKKKRKVNR
jgi:TonB family protein